MYAAVKQSSRCSSLKIILYHIESELSESLTLSLNMKYPTPLNYFIHSNLNTVIFQSPN